MHPGLKNLLGGLERLYHRARFWQQLARCWLATAAVEFGLFLIRVSTGWNTRPLWWLVLAGGCAAACFVLARERKRQPDFSALIAALEKEHPGVRHLLATAAEQKPASDSGKFDFLQLRVIEQVRRHPDKILWGETFDRKKSSARNAQFAALAALLIVLCLSPRGPSRAGAVFAEGVVVSPGDTEVERGTSLVISARFNEKIPAEATLVLDSDSGKTKRVALTRQLSDPIFGTSLMEVSENARYHLEYGAQKTRDFKISVFDYPSLTRADAALQFPAYTGLTNRVIPDTFRISAVEGTRLTYTFQLNKPVAQARLISQEETLPLTVQTNALAMLNGFTLTNSARYSLQLVDAEGRTNKTPAEFVIQVLPDRLPEVKITFPHGDQRVSSLEELQLQGEARDDFGLLKYGIGFSVAGEAPQFIELGQAVPAQEPRQFTNQIALEKLHVNVNQLVSYFAWAEDYGPDGKPRRTFSDIFFAEVRPFEEIFRADQSGAEDQNQGGGGGQGNNGTRLAELQKQIVIATWKLQREKQNPAKGALP